jgi:hypothetical protein
MADKKKKKKGVKKNVGRRSFLRTGAVAIGAAAVGGAACTTTSPSTSPIAMAAPVINAEKLQMFLNDPALQKSWLAQVKDVAHQLATDAALREKFLSNTESVRLIKIFNDHQSVLEPLVGTYDGRTLEGRMAKMVIAAEVFDNVSGPDFAYEGLEYQDDKCCSNYNGCCIVHSWGSYYGKYC